ncbi:BAX inhibitor (BI)-1/YccA family protein [Clostridiaceae bacterium DONG20-135]|uniref:BAX inhibitor (BI)-1/YccA family protein n=1 Tax=Copranaerobaculum intestinale TaxID=2692629 RepID=A0A6N8UBX3_9FIRM|nr:Bax inhibitor-1/YccA family protein [Copranaerobaculum intestinale]MXQ73167.1 BAX inhibitor (BI)-1/YccA family protein [Copranaerobaculum intestinale]
MYSNPDIDVQSSGTTLSQHVYKTFGLMFIGLMVTFLTSYLLYQTNLVYYIIGSYTMLSLVILVVQLGVVFSLVRRLHSMSITSARVMFLAYSILTGISFSVLGLIYDAGSIYLAFGVTAVFFGALSVIGFTTKLNMSKFAPVLFIGLIMLVIVNVMGIFFDFSGMERIICSAGILLFTGITVYDTQKMKALYMANQGDEEMLSRLSIYSAFDLYLDFINIFIYILRMLGNRD